MTYVVDVQIVTDAESVAEALRYTMQEALANGDGQRVRSLMVSCRELPEQPQ